MLFILVIIEGQVQTRVAFYMYTTKDRSYTRVLN